MKNEYYEDIEEFPKSDLLEFNDKVFSIIKNHVNNINSDVIIFLPVSNDYVIKLRLCNKATSLDGYGWEECSIVQLPDEWFIFSNFSKKKKFYKKCDQLDGLLKCLGDYYGGL